MQNKIFQVFFFPCRLILNPQVELTVLTQSDKIERVHRS